MDKPCSPSLPRSASSYHTYSLARDACTSDGQLPDRRLHAKMPRQHFIMLYENHMRRHARNQRRNYGRTALLVLARDLRIQITPKGIHTAVHRLHLLSFIIYCWKNLFTGQSCICHHHDKARQTTDPQPIYERLDTFDAHTVQTHTLRLVRRLPFVRPVCWSSKEEGQISQSFHVSILNTFYIRHTS
jgi:hypothetical protein